MIDINFIKDFIIPVVVGICLCVGYVIKKIDCINNKYIPLIVMVLGLFISIWFNNELKPLNEWVITCEIVFSGLVSGLASTGLYELFDNLIHGKKEEILEDPYKN